MREQPDNEWRWESRIWSMNYEGYRFNIATGHHPDGRILELAYSGPHDGSALARILDDTCLLINALVQRHVDFDRLSAIVRRTADGGMESIVGHIVMEIAQDGDNDDGG